MGLHSLLNNNNMYVYAQKHISITWHCFTLKHEMWKYRFYPKKTTNNKKYKKKKPKQNNKNKQTKKTYSIMFDFIHYLCLSLSYLYLINTTSSTV